MDTYEKVREDRVRRMLARQGYKLTKSNRRDPRAWDYGGYIATYLMAGDVDSGRVARYCRSLDEAEKWALDEDRPEDLKQASGRPAADWEEIGTVTVGANWLDSLGCTGYGPHQLKVLRDPEGRIKFIRADPT